MCKLNSSDIGSSEMVASKAFDHLLENVKCSNLNYMMHLSPFSATIYLKKSLIRDKFGSVILPDQIGTKLTSVDDTQELNEKIIKLQNAVDNLENLLHKTESDRDAAFKKIDFLEKQLQIKNVQEEILIKEEIASLVSLNEALKKENELKNFQLSNFNKVVKEKEVQLACVNNKLIQEANIRKDFD